MKQVVKEAVAAQKANERADPTLQPRHCQDLQPAPLVAYPGGSEPEEHRREPREYRAIVAAQGCGAAEAQPTCAGRIQPLHRDGCIDHENCRRRRAGQPPWNPEEREPGEVPERDHVQNAEEDVILRRREPGNQGDGKRGENDDGEAPAPASPADAVEMRKIQAGARKKEKAPGNRGGEQPPVEPLVVAAVLQAEELEIVNEVEDGHADERNAPEKVEERDAWDGNRGVCWPALGLPAGAGLPTSSPRHVADPFRDREWRRFFFGNTTPKARLNKRKPTAPHRNGSGRAGQDSGSACCLGPVLLGRRRNRAMGALRHAGVPT